MFQIENGKVLHAQQKRFCCPHLLKYLAPCIHTHARTTLTIRRAYASETATHTNQNIKQKNFLITGLHFSCAICDEHLFASLSTCSVTLEQRLEYFDSLESL